MADLTPDSGSFRDRSSRVFDDGERIVRGLDTTALKNWTQLVDQQFFRDALDRKDVVATEILPSSESVLPADWAGAVAHERIPFISYPYEWSFGMLQDAALLHLRLLEEAMEHGWTLKDASAYNIQWKNCLPVFIDTPSYEPYSAGEPWKAYRQFCMMFLNPLLLQAYKGIDFRPLLRSNLEGIAPDAAASIFTGLSKFRKGVFGNVYLHAKMQSRAAKKDLDEAKSLTETSNVEMSAHSGIRHSEAMVMGTIQSVRRTIEKLRNPADITTWGNYDTDHSYSEASFDAKSSFVEKNAATKRRKLVWDIGRNTGTFSRLCSPYADAVLSIDGDPKAIERLYQTEKHNADSNILPLIMDIGNMSPNQGWRGLERKSLERRGKPDLVVCLALMHHIVISANIPLDAFVDWLRSLDSDIIIEFVSAADDMSRMLLRNRVNQYKDLTENQFESLIGKSFAVIDKMTIKAGDRTLYYLTPQ